MHQLAIVKPKCLQTYVVCINKRSTTRADSRTLSLVSENQIWREAGFSQPGCLAGYEALFLLLIAKHTHTQICLRCLSC